MHDKKGCNVVEKRLASVNAVFIPLGSRDKQNQTKNHTETVKNKSKLALPSFSWQPRSPARWA